MQKISMIVAIAENNAIGKDNQLLWHLPNDLKFFKNTTWGLPIIMGRKTFESVNKPLPGRINIVVTRQLNWQHDNVVASKNLDDALQKAAETSCNEVFIIGGGEIYRATLPFTTTLFITRVKTKIEGDTFFPVLKDNEWSMESICHFEKDEKHLYDYSFEKWIRVQKAST